MSAEDGIEKSVLRITVWYQEACQVMTNADFEGRFFLSHPNTNKGAPTIYVLVEKEEK